MLDRIIATGFKGLDFNQPIGRLNLMVGPNGSGKSARSQAALLAILGHVPGVGRRNQDILEAFGTDGKLSVGVEINGKILERRFSESSTGTVKQEYRINGRKADKSGFERALQDADPRILDLSVFLALSDQKKIDQIFELFPPAGDVEKLVNAIEDLTEGINVKNANAKGAEASIASLKREKANLALPAGTHADILGEIENVEADLAEARKELETAKIERAKEEAAAEATKKEKARAEEEAKSAPPPPAQTPESTLSESGNRTLPPYSLAGALAKNIPAEPTNPLPPTPSVVESIQAIMDAMGRAGCSACAAMLVAKREMKKYRGGETS